MSGFISSLPIPRQFPRRLRSPFGMPIPARGTLSACVDDLPDDMQQKTVRRLVSQRGYRNLSMRRKIEARATLMRTRVNILKIRGLVGDT